MYRSEAVARAQVDRIEKGHIPNQSTLPGFTRLDILKLMQDFYIHYERVLFAITVQAFKLYNFDSSKYTSCFSTDVLVIQLEPKKDFQVGRSSARNGFEVTSIMIASFESYYYDRCIESASSYSNALERANSQARFFRQAHLEAVQSGHVGLFRTVIHLGGLSCGNHLPVRLQTCQVEPFEGWHHAFVKLVELGKGSKGVPLLASDAVIASLLQ